MSSINNNIWEIAEVWLSGKMQPADLKELKDRLANDPAYANEFNEHVNMLSSFEGSGKQKRFRAMLKDIHAKQAVNAPVKKTKVIRFIPQTWRTAAIAASVALFSSLFTVWSLKPSMKKSDSQYSTISREVEHIKKVQAQQQATQNQLIKDIKNSKPAPPPSDVAYSGTGFALTNDGYFITANHVIHHNNKGDFDSVYIQNHDGQYFKATLINYDANADIAILKVEKKNFHFGKGEVPYTFAADKSNLGARIFTLGYPKDDIFYNEGYISSRNGFDGNDMQYTLALPASHGQSGSPVLSENGVVLGILTGIGSERESSTYAVSSKVIINKLLNELPDNTLHLPKANKLGKLTREERIAKMEAYTFSVKVYKK